MLHNFESRVLGNAPIVTPATADTINSIIVSGIEGTQAISPAIAAASAGVTGLAIAYDRLKTGGVLNKLAARDTFRAPKNRAGRVRIALGYAALAVLPTAPTAAVVGGASFVLGTEQSVRQGQLEAVNTMFDRAGVSDSDILITQGGVDTPMSTSNVPREIAEELGGAGFHVQLPKISNKSDTGQMMDGLLLSVPNLEPNTVVASGLTGLNKGDEAIVGGHTFTISEQADRELASMQRETLLVSNDVAELIQGYDDEKGSYFGVYMPQEGIDRGDLQRELDAQYGEGRYSVITADEFKEGVEKFMGKNGSPILLLAAVAMAAAGVVTESAAAYRKTMQNRRALGVMKAMGATDYDVGAPEVLGAYYRLLSAVPGSALAGMAAAMGANAINLGLSSTVGAKELVGAMVVVGVPSMASTIVATRKIARGTQPAEAMRV